MDDLQIANISEFQDCLNGLQESSPGFLYRGQPESQWPVCCSALRRLSPNQKCSSDDFWTSHKIVGYSEFLLSNTRMRQFFPPGLKDESNDMILLAHLQHQGAATALIDFTRQPLVALLFACNKSPKSNGAVYVLPLSTTQEIKNIEESKKNIGSFYGENKMWAWEPPPRSNRVVAQNSVFVFGVAVINPSKMLKITVQADCKGRIEQQLERRYGINEERMVLDYSGFAKINAVEQSVDSKHTVDYWRRIAEESPGQSRNATAYYNYGMANLAIGEWSNATEQFDKAIEICTDFEDAFHMRGLARSILGLHHDAIRDFSETIRVNPNNHEAILRRGMSYRALGRIEDANKDFADASRLRQIENS